MQAYAQQHTPSGYGPPPSIQHVETEAHAVEERKAALFEMVYLVISVSLYITAVFWPLFGGIAGAFLMIGGTHPGTRRVGKITLICALAGLVLYVALVMVWVLLLGASAAASAV